MLNLDGMSAYMARPAAPGRYPGVVVGFQLFGLDASVRDLADRLAAAGYVVIVPDLYHRTAPLAELPADDEGRRRGFELLHRLRRDEVLADVERCVRYLREEGGAGHDVGMVGLSMGGHVAFLAAARLDLTATAVLYPGWLTGTEIALSRPEPTLALAPGIAGRLLFLVGDRDHVVPSADVAAIGAALSDAKVDHEIVVYPDTPHAFLFGGGSPAPAADAWRRILALLERLR